jgi:hypothetical protein
MKTENLHLPNRFPKLDMKLPLHAMVLSILLGGCSSPKYSYYFDRYSTHRKTVTPKTKIPVQLQDGTLEASTRKEAFVPPPKMKAAASASEEKFVLQTDKPNSKRPQGSITIEKKSLPSETEGDKAKNDFAVAGFVLAFSPIVAGLFAWFLVPGPVPFIIGGIGYVLAIVFSSIGLKSEERKLARAAITIIVVEGVLMLIGGVIAMSTFSAL